MDKDKDLPPKTYYYSFYKKPHKEKSVNTQPDPASSFFKNDLKKIYSSLEKIDQIFQTFAALSKTKEIEFRHFLKNQCGTSESEMQEFRKHLINDSHIVDLIENLKDARLEIIAHLKKIDIILEITDESHFLHGKITEMRNACKDMRKSITSQLKLFSALKHDIKIAQRALKTQVNLNKIQTEENDDLSTYPFVRDYVKQRLIKSGAKSDDEIDGFMNEENTRIFIKKTSLVYDHCKENKPAFYMMEGFVEATKKTTLQEQARQKL